MEPFRADRNELRERFGFSARTGARISALAQKGLYFTEAALEVIAEDENLVKTVLSGKFMEQAGQMDPHRLTTLLREHAAKDVADEVGLAISGKGVVHLVDEAVADGKDAKGAVELRVRTGERNFRYHWTDTEIEKIRLTLATSARKDEKIEAVRKIAVSDLSAEDKGTLFLETLNDPDPDVKKEAVTALGTIGLKRRIVDVFAALLSDDTGERTKAARMLLEFAEKAEGGDLFIVLMMVNGFLASDPDPEVEIVLIDIFSTLSFLIVRDEHVFRRTVRRIVGRMQKTGFAALATTEKFLRKISSLDPDLFYRIVFGEEVRHADDLALKSILLLNLSELPALDKKRRHELLAAVISGMFGAPEMDDSYWRLQSAVANLCPEFYGRIVEIFGGLKTDEQRRALRMLNRAVTDAPPQNAKIAKALGEFLLCALQDLPLGLRLIAYESDIPGLKGITDTTLTGIVRLLFKSADETLLSSTRTKIETCLAAVPRAAVTGAAEIIFDKNASAGRAEMALRILGQIALECADLDAAARKKILGVYAHLKENFPTERVRPGTIVALGKIAATAFVAPDEPDELYDFLMENAGEDDIDAVSEAVGYIAGGKHASLRKRFDASFFLMEQLNRPLSDDLLDSEKNSDGDTVFCTRPDSERYTVLIPILLSSIERLAVGPAITDTLRENLARALLVKWKQLAAVRITWSPFAMHRLTEALAAIGVSERVPLYLKIKIADALTAALNFTHAAIAVAKICAGCTEKSPLLDKIAQKAAAELGAILKDRAALTPDALARAQVSLGYVAMRLARMTEIPPIFERAVACLQRAMADENPELVPILSEIADVENVPSEIRRSLRQSVEHHRTRNERFLNGKRERKTKKGSAPK